MSITFECSVCGKPLSARNNYAGKQGRCKCGTPLIVPGSVERMKFACPHCAHGISVSPRHIGKKGKCPTCRQIITIPCMAKILSSNLTILPLRRSKPAQTGSAAASLAATVFSPGASFVPAPIPVSKPRPELIIDIIDAACRECATTFKVKQQSSPKKHRCPACGASVEVPGSDPQPVSPTSANTRKTKNSVSRIYWTLSLTALTGPLCYLAVYILFLCISGGSPVPATGGRMYTLGLGIKWFPLIVSPLAIALAVGMKFRYNIKAAWPLNTAVLCYAVFLYTLIDN